jgi:hypothetical protein
VGKRAQRARAVAEDLRVERARLRHIQKFECFVGESQAEMRAWK